MVGSHTAAGAINNVSLMLWESGVLYSHESGGHRDKSSVFVAAFQLTNMIIVCVYGIFSLSMNCVGSVRALGLFTFY